MQSKCFNVSIILHSESYNSIKYYVSNRTSKNSTTGLLFYLLENLQYFKKTKKKKKARVFSTQQLKLICTILHKIFNAKLVIKSISKFTWVPTEMGKYPAGLLKKLRNGKENKQKIFK